MWCDEGQLIKSETVKVMERIVNVENAQKQRKKTKEGRGSRKEVISQKHLASLFSYEVTKHFSCCIKVFQAQKIKSRWHENNKRRRKEHALFENIHVGLGVNPPPPHISSWSKQLSTLLNGLVSLTGKELLEATTQRSLLSAATTAQQS